MRFKRRDILPLHALPSAAGQELHPVAGREHVHWMRHVAVAAGLIASLLVLLAVIGFAILRFGVEGNELTNRTRMALQDAAGEEWKTGLETARITLDAHHFLAVEAAGVTVANKATGKPLGTIDSVRLGLAPLALIGGTVKIATIEIDGMHLAVDALPGQAKRTSPDFLDKIGLVDTRKVYEAVFSGASRAIHVLDHQSMRRISISGTRIDLPDSQLGNNIFIEQLNIWHGSAGMVELSGDVDVRGNRIQLAGSLSRAKDGAVGLELSAGNIRIPLPKLDIDKDKGETLLTRRGLASVKLHGIYHSATPGVKNVLQADIELAQDPAASAEYKLFSGRFEIAPDTRKVEIAQAKFSMGKTVLDFNGAVEPVAADGPRKQAHYRYNLVSTSAIFAPADSPEPPLAAGIRIAGTIDKKFRRFNGDELALRTKDGELVGQFTVVRAGMGAPALFLALHVPEMPVSQAKQLWPVFSASGAREWAMQNVFGGSISDSQIEMSVGPGRFGDGIALNADEITGHFAIEKTRFDVAGDIPPVRDAVGIIDFRGTDVDIALKSGTAYLPSNRTVSASNGTLKVRAADKPPVIGNLSIDVSGKADAIAELASFEPISALRYVDIKPEQLSGDVSGHLNVEIPVSKQRPDRKLDWSADLNVSDLTISKEVDGQKISNAKGELKLKPGQAVIDGDADLNGIPAHLSLVEPFGDNAADVQRKRDVTLILDADARSRLAAGLNTILKGPVKLKVLGGEASDRKLAADLTDTELTLPWIGWSKGAGIPASANFVLKTDQKNLTLSDFVFSGESFGAKGNIEVTGGTLSKIDFPKLALNRGDDFSFSLKRAASGYEIAIKGARADLRPVVKKYSKFTSNSSGIGDQPVHLVANLDTVTGFADQAYEGFTMELATGAGKLNDLKVAFARKPEIASKLDYQTDGEKRSLAFRSPDLGSFLKFVGAYDHMEAGKLKGALAASSGGPLLGEVDVRDFWLVDEPRLKSMTAATGAPGNDRRFYDALPENFDSSRIRFDRGYAFIENGNDYLKVDQGIIRGPALGSTFEGMIYDGDGQMSLTGTFIPAYGINSAFSQIPILGYMLGNGRDRGLIGLTYKLTGDPVSPDVQFNPLSIIAPGIFRSIFEYH